MNASSEMTVKVLEFKSLRERETDRGREII